MRDGNTVHLTRGSQLRTRVETEPSQPKNEHTQGSNQQVVTRNSVALLVLTVFTNTGTQCQSTNQGQNTTHRVYDGRTSKIVEHITKGGHHETVHSIIAQPAATPGPVTFDRIDEQRDDCTINKVHRELGTLGHSTTDDCGRGGTEHGLKDQEALNRQFAVIKTQVAPVGQANKTSQRVGTEHETEAEEEEQKRAEHEVDKVLHEDVSGVLTACKTCLTQGEAWLHPENQHGCQ